MYIGEDIYFCKLAQANGMKVYVDHDLSKDVRHIGVMEFTHDHAEIDRPDPMTETAALMERLQDEKDQSGKEDQ
jgi:hypothetical protein